MKFKSEKPDRKIRKRLEKTGWKLARKTEMYEFYTGSGEFDPEFEKEDTIQLWINRKGEISGLQKWEDGHCVHGIVYKGVEI